MNRKTSLIALAMVFLIAMAWAQTTTTATYSGGSILVHYIGAGEPTTGSYSWNPVTLTVNIPVGDIINSVDVSYNMTTTDDRYAYTQRSYLACTSSGGTTESSVSQGNSVYPFTGNSRTITYNRTGLTLANGVVSGGNIVFVLHTFVTDFEDYTFLDSGTFTVTVHHTASTPNAFRAVPDTPTSLKVTWGSGNPVLLVYNSIDSFEEPTDGVVYTAGSNLGTATVLYTGSLNEFIHTGLNTLTTYYYRIWAYSDTHLYTDGASTVGTTSNHISLLTENFEGTTFPPVGWTRGTTASNWERLSQGEDGWCAGVYTRITQTSALLSTPPLNFTKTRYRVSLWVNRSTTYTTQNYLQVLLNDAPSFANATEITKIFAKYNSAPAEPAAGWYQYSYDINVDPGLKYIVFKGFVKVNGPYVSIDGICIEELSDFPQGEGTVFNDITINPSEDLDLDNSIDGNHPIITSLPSYASLGQTQVLGLTGTGNNVSIDVTAPTGSWYGSIYYGGNWHQSDPVFIGELDVSRVFAFTGVDFTAKAGEVIILLSEGENSTLPVELSVFNAILTAQNYVKLNWVSESETNMLGYRVYRGENLDPENALMITPVMISATNTSTTANYTHEDHEVTSGVTYYYWLESVDFCSSQLHGPQSVTLSDPGNDPGQPEVQLVTRLLPNYPNPFNPSTTIAYQLNAPETVRLSIYNVRGQLVRSFQKTHTEAGNYNLAFDGLDNHGRSLSSGIYYCVMQAGNVTSRNKMILMK